MNPALSPQRYALRTFAAHRIAAGVTASSFSPLGFATCDPIKLDVDSLDAALPEALRKAGLFHKDLLVIRETGRHVVNGRQGEPLDWLHVYKVKRRSAPDYVRKGFEVERVQRLYAEHVVTIDGAVLG